MIATNIYFYYIHLEILKMHVFIKFSNEFKLMAQNSDFRSVAGAKLNDQNITLY